MVTHVDPRRRPPVDILDRGLVPDHSFPSGHVATAVVAYGGLFLLTVAYVAAARRLALPLLLLPVVVLLSRLYQGAHHLTDVLTSVGYASLWLLVLARLLLPRVVGTLTERGNRLVPPARSHQCGSVWPMSRSSTTGTSGGVLPAIAASTTSCCCATYDARKASSLPVPKRQARGRPIQQREKRCSSPRSPRHISSSPTYCALGKLLGGLEEEHAAVVRRVLEQVARRPHLEVHDLEAAPPRAGPSTAVVAAVPLPAGAGHYLRLGGEGGRVGPVAALMSVQRGGGTQVVPAAAEERPGRRPRRCARRSRSSRPSMVITVPP